MLKGTKTPSNGHINKSGRERERERERERGKLNRYSLDMDHLKPQHFVYNWRVNGRTMLLVIIFTPPSFLFLSSYTINWP